MALLQVKHLAGGGAANKGRVPTVNPSGLVVISEPSLSGVINLRDGESATSSTNTTEPTQFGQSGMLLQRFRRISFSDLLVGGNRIRRLRLRGDVTLSNNHVSGNGISNCKLALRLENSITPLFTAAQSVTGNTEVHLKYDMDVLQALLDASLGDPQDGNLFFAFAVWSDIGSAVLGSGSVSNPNPSGGLLFEVGL